MILVGNKIILRFHNEIISRVGTGSRPVPGRDGNGVSFPGMGRFCQILPIPNISRDRCSILVPGREWVIPVPNLTLNFAPKKST